MKILLLTPEIQKMGGIANYFKSAYYKFHFEVEYFLRGSRHHKSLPILDIIRIFKDYWDFLIKIKNKDYKIIHINTSLGAFGVLRDSVFILISKFYNRKIVQFFRGWDKRFEKQIQKFYLPFFKIIYTKVDVIIVLASEFKNKLLEWGFKKEIFLESTIVDENLISDFNIQDILEKIHKKNRYFTILFLARIEKDKGIIEALKTYQILKEKFNSIQLIIAGEGSCLNKAKDFSIKNNLQDIIFTGYVSGLKKRKIFMESDIYLFPTYGEGMPNSLLEAMAFGLPLITRPMGGIKDFFENEKMGFITESKDPKTFAKLIQALIENKNLRLNISINNYNYAKEHFYASLVIKRIEKIYENLLNLEK